MADPTPLASEEQAKREREALCDTMRVVGMLQAAHEILRSAGNHPGCVGIARSHALEAQRFANKALLTAWEAQS